MSLEPYDAHDNSLQDANHLIMKSSIMDWWKRNNVTKPIECKYKNTNRYSKNEFTHLLSVPEIKIFPCSGNVTSPKFLFEGMLREGHLEGKGKLVFINESEWSKLSHSDSKRKQVMAMMKMNICFKLSNIQAKDIKEIIGTFKNGSIHGLAKITYLDSSFCIGHYKNGKAHGYSRTFSSDNGLLDAGGYYSGLEVGYVWRHRFGHLLYQKEEMVSDNISPTLVFAIANDGSLADPIAGDYFHPSGTLTNVVKVDLINTISSKSNCMLDIEYRLSSVENYTYSLSSKNKYPIFGNKEYQALCNGRKRYIDEDVTKTLRNWIEYITDLLEVRLMQPGIDVSRAPEILWQLRPQLKQLDKANSIRLISDIHLCTETKSMKASILGSPPVKIAFGNGDIKLDHNLTLNGFNHLIVVLEYQQYVPGDKSLGWYPTQISGNFERGVLNGLALVKTNVSTTVWAMLRDGILHGPCVVYGISYIIGTVS